MVKAALIETVRQDVEILFSRALVGQVITCFGEDGFGKYGRSEFPVSFTISRIDVEIEDLDPNSLTSFGARLFISLDGYDASRYGGTAASDQNALISLKNLLTSASIDPGSIGWAPLSHQGQHVLALDVDLHRLDIF